MQTLPTFSALSTANRGAPCAEYPGTWRVFGYSMDRQVTRDCATLEAAISEAKSLYDSGHAGLSVCWEASEADPRVGQVWFTGFYQHGRIDLFGCYRQS